MKTKEIFWQFKDIIILELLVALLGFWQIREYRVAEPVHQNLLLCSVILAAVNAILAIISIKKLKILTYLFLITALVFSAVVLYYLKYIVVYKII